MKWSKIALTAALFGAIYGTNAWAQVPVQPAVGKPVSYFQIADVYTQGSPSDAAMPAGGMEMGMPTVDMMAASEEPAEEEAEEEDEGPWRLFCQQEGCWNAYGWLNMGYAANAHGNNVPFNGPVTFYDRNNEFSANQIYAVLEKKLPGEADYCNWNFGGRLDYVYGFDSRFTTEVGWELDQAGGARWNAADAFYGHAIPQAYLEAGRGDWTFKAGRFYTLIGYEGVMAPVNFFPTHAYTMQYGEPFTHTGALATKKISDKLTATGGIVNGWNAFDRLNDHVAVTGGGTWTNGEKLTVALYGIVGNEPRPGDGVYTTRQMYSLVVTYAINECWTYVLQHDNASHTNALPGGVDAEWYGVNQYLFRTINDKLKVGGRFEWFRDDDGVRVTGLHPNNPIAGGAFPGNFYEVALGANWTPHKNVVIRPELRADWYDGVGNPYGNADATNQFMFAIDAILHW